MQVGDNIFFADKDRKVLCDERKDSLDKPGLTQPDGSVFRYSYLALYNSQIDIRKGMGVIFNAHGSRSFNSVNSGNDMICGRILAPDNISGQYNPASLEAHSADFCNPEFDQGEKSLNVHWLYGIRDSSIRR